MDFRQQKRTAQENAARKKTERKKLGRYKRNKTQNMPTSEELRGDSPSGLAANAPVSLGFELTFLSEFK